MEVLAPKTKNQLIFTSANLAKQVGVAQKFLDSGWNVQAIGAYLDQTRCLPSNTSVVNEIPKTVNGLLTKWMAVLSKV